jgi:hypothetical protein
MAEQLELTREQLARVANPFALLMHRYARNRVAFVREVFGVEPDAWQKKALGALDAGHTRLAIRSGHGVGKSTFDAWALAHFLLTRFPCKAVVTAPSAPQLFDALWAELRAWISKLPSGWLELLDVLTDRIALRAAPDEAFISARTSRQETPDAMQGIHSQSVMLLADEAAGIPEEVFEAAGGSMSTPGAITILTGNPTRTTGFFWRVHTLERDRWFTMRVSSLDSPRVDPEYAREIAERYGVDSNNYRVRVLGEFPLQDGDSLISTALVEEAMQRAPIIDFSVPERWGVDVARYGPDFSVLIKRRGFAVTEPLRRWANADTMMLSGSIYNEWRRAGENRPEVILVDSIGIGAGTFDRLRELGLPVVEVVVSQSPSIEGRFNKLRDELWQSCADWLGSRRCSLPLDDGLRDALVAPKYRYTSDGKLKIQSKDEIKADGFRSPDEADALCMTFAHPGIGAELGSAQSWKRALHRGIRGII